MISPQFLIIDLFCGAGGTTTGFVASGIAKVIACVNHDPIQIKSHWENHKEVIHFEEDIRSLDLTDLIAVVKKWRAIYPNAKLILWASLECTNFSKAKGGQPRNADSRTLAEHLDRYVLALKPDYIQIENVVEFMSWGPLDEKGKPVSRKGGRDWLKWCNQIDSFGYRNEWKELNSADFGAYTSRNRLFGCFAKGDLPIVWPEATHSKKPTLDNMFHVGLKKWMPVKDVLDFEDEGKSIFNRKIPLVDASLERIEAGLIKFAAGGKENLVNEIPFIMKYNSMASNGDKKHCVSSVEKPLSTITTFGGGNVVNVQHINPSFLAKYYGNGDNIGSIEEPAGTIRTKDTISKIQPIWLDKCYSGVENIGSIENPSGTLMPNDKHRIVQCEPIILNPSHGGHTMTTNAPCPVIVARQDKAPLYLIQFKYFEDVSVPIYETDSDVMIRIKNIMAILGISDIKMRMLKVAELLKIQGFPDNYKLHGNQTQQKKGIGNSVNPKVVTDWTIALGKALQALAIAA